MALILLGASRPYSLHRPLIVNASPRPPCRSSALPAIFNAGSNVNVWPPTIALPPRNTTGGAAPFCSVIAALIQLSGIPLAVYGNAVARVMGDSAGNGPLRR